MSIFLDGKRSDSMKVELGNLTVEASSDVTESLVNAGMAAVNKATIIDLDLSVARDKAAIFAKGSVISVLEKGTGVWELIFENADLTEVSLSSNELVRRDTFAGDFLSLKITNLAQTEVELPKLWIGERV